MPNSHSETTHWLPAGLFSPGTEEEWKALILKELKGLPFEKVLSSTLEGEEIQPFYTEASESKIPYLQHSDWFGFIREENPAYLRILQTLNPNVSEPFETDFSADEMCWVIQEESAIEALASVAHSHVDIRLPYSEGIRAAILSRGIKGFADWRAESTPLSMNWPKDFRPYSFSARPYHLSGSNAIQEIAFVLHDFVCWADQVTEQEGVPLFTILPFVHFRFSLGPDLLSGMALIRAFRGLYFQLLKKYQIEQPESPVILADASLRFYTSLDANNNLLRAGSAGMAAMSTGCAGFEAWPFSGKAPQAFANRMNRNLIRLMREESYVSYTADPLGGAWALENLTWNRMLAAEQLLQACETNLSQLASFKQAQIRASRTQMEDLVATGRLNLIGVNLHADLSQEAEGLYHFDGMPDKVFRLAAPFETLQLQGRTLPGYRFHFTCAEKDCQARADFVKQFMSVCGLKQSDHPEALWVLCGKDEDYTTSAVLQTLNETKASRIWILAGNPKEGKELLENAGVQIFIHLQSNRVNTAQMLHKWLSA